MTRTRAAAATSAPESDPEARVVKIPLPSGFEVEIKLPRNLSIADLRRVPWGLLPYPGDWDPRAQAPGKMFPQLEGADDLRAS
jgi:hypothetical protein